MGFPSENYTEWEEQNRLAHRTDISALYDHDTWWKGAFGRIEQKLGPLFHQITRDAKNDCATKTK